MTGYSSLTTEAGQLSLFADDADGPAGLDYWAELISAETEQDLIDMIKLLPLRPFQFGAYEGKRKVASFGFHYDFSARRLQNAEPIPARLQAPASKIESFRSLAAGSIRHVLCTEYDVGVGIGWHRDKPQFDQVFGLSLGSSCRFRFRRKSADRWKGFTLDAQPRSLYLMTGDARHVWEHTFQPSINHAIPSRFARWRTNNASARRTKLSDPHVQYVCRMDRL